MTKNMFLRVVICTLGVVMFSVGIYIGVEPIGRIMTAISGILLAVAGVLICMGATLAERGRFSR
ncbi:MAG: hypothetical protein Q8Q22_01285 [bacterium]|nr:hypothetical protein [bacterium]